MTADIFLSIIIPAHNEEHRLPPTLKAVDAYLDKQRYTSEVIVVENGSQDQTAVVIDAFAANPGAGVLKLDGRMIDRPHLIQAQRVLAAGE